MECLDKDTHTHVHTTSITMSFQPLAFTFVSFFSFSTLPIHCNILQPHTHDRVYHMVTLKRTLPAHHETESLTGSLDEIKGDFQWIVCLSAMAKVSLAPRLSHTNKQTSPWDITDKWACWQGPPSPHFSYLPTNTKMVHHQHSPTANTVPMLQLENLPSGGQQPHSCTSRTPFESRGKKCHVFRNRSHRKSIDSTRRSSAAGKKKHGPYWNCKEITKTLHNYTQTLSKHWKPETSKWEHTLDRQVPGKSAQVLVDLHKIWFWWKPLGWKVSHLYKLSITLLSTSKRRIVGTLNSNTRKMAKSFW